MGIPRSVFHLAIPCSDLELAKRYYGGSLECKIAREYDDRITINFFGDQIVCHLSPDSIDVNPKMYPRHFGVTFREKNEFDRMLELAKRKHLRFFQEPMERFRGAKEKHWTFFLIDPSNNLLEFKCYDDPHMMY